MAVSIHNSDTFHLISNISNIILFILHGISSVQWGIHPSVRRHGEPSPWLSLLLRMLEITRF